MQAVQMISSPRESVSVDLRGARSRGAELPTHGRTTHGSRQRNARAPTAQNCAPHACSADLAATRARHAPPPAAVRAQRTVRICAATVAATRSVLTSWTQHSRCGGDAIHAVRASEGHNAGAHRS